MRNNPAIRRAYWRAFQDIVNGPLNNAFMDPILDAKAAALAANKTVDVHLRLRGIMARPPGRCKRKIEGVGAGESSRLMISSKPKCHFAFLR